MGDPRSDKKGDGGVIGDDEWGAPSAYLDALAGQATRCHQQTVDSLPDTEEKEEDSPPSEPWRLYQKIHRTKIRTEVMRRGYGLLNEEAEAERVALARDPDTEVTVMTPEEAQAEERKVEDQAVERVRTNRAARMSMLRTTAMELFAAEPEDVRAEVLAQMEEMNEGVPATSCQRWCRKSTGAIEEETGWMGLFMAGGPMPNRDGAISIKTFCFGTTPNGADFAASHSNFGEVKGAFGKFLKRAFPTLDNESDDEGEEASPASAPSKVKPKRVRRKKLAAAVSAAVSPGRRRARPVPTPALSAPATDAVFPIPDDFDLTIQDIVTNLNGINGVTTEQEDAAWALGPADGWDGIVPPAEDPEAASPWNGLSLPSTLGEEDVTLGVVLAVRRVVRWILPAFSAPDSGSVSRLRCALGNTPRDVGHLRISYRNDAHITCARCISTLTTLAATPLEPTPTPSTPDEGPPRSACCSRRMECPPTRARAIHSLSPEAPEFPELRPRANVPRGHPLAPVKKVAPKKASGEEEGWWRRRGRGRGRGEGEEEEEEVQVPPPPPPPSSPGTPASLTGAAAAAESARLRGEEQRLRRDRTEQLRLSKDLEKKDCGGGGPLTGACAQSRWEPYVREVTKKRGGTWEGSQLAVPLADPNARQAETDAALLASLKTGKRKADAPAAAKRKKARR
ncbi:hypothetical protein B0H14DRAFT_3470207 [Mycena olivaceomarginata]|nr:hypothetical protein B0H14DRAFT_3470207 [Mycena olivaceomarginata]